MVKKFSWLIALIVSCLSLMQLRADSVVIGDRTWFYSVADGQATITGVSPKTGSITIPNNVNAIPVTTIGDYAFDDCSGLTSVTIPEGVTEIGLHAFDDCSGLTSVTIPSSVTAIGGSAFSGCSGLTSVTIPSNVTTIGGYAFLDCSRLTSVVIPSGVTTIGNHAFSGCSRLPSVVIPSGVTTIGNHAFSGCSRLTSVTIPEGVTTIGNYAFSDCSGLTSVTIPEGVTTIGNYVFSGCSRLTSVTIPEGVTTIVSYAFSGCSGLTSVTIPDSVTEIGYYAFSGCSGLTSVTIPSSVTTIGGYAFYKCSGLTSVTIPEGVTTIGGYAFAGCLGLTSVTIPDSVTSIGDWAFAGCDGLREVHINDLSVWCRIDFNGNLSNPLHYAGHLYLGDEEVSDLSIPEGMTSIGGSAFSGCSGLTSVTIPSSVTTIGSYAFSGCSGLTSVTIPSGVTRISDHAFSSCSGLTSVTISEGVTSIGSYAFRDCSGLTSVTIPSGVTRISDHAFFYCSGLTSVTISEGVTSIESGAFSGCSGLTSVTIPSSVTTIGGYAFSGCSGLTSVTIPSSVTTIGGYAFSGCVRLREVHIGDLSAWYRIAFNGNLSNPLYYAHHLYLDDEEVTDLSIPEGVTTIGDQAFSYCSGLTSVTVPDSVTMIGDYAFYKCSALSSCRLSETLSRIGEYAFAYSGLESVTIPGKVSFLSEYAFAGCTNLVTAEVHEGVRTIGRYAFKGCSRLEQLNLPSSLEHLGWYMSGSKVYEKPLTVFNGCKSLAYIDVAAGNAYFSSNQGVLCNATKTEIILVPPGLKKLVIPKGVSTLPSLGTLEDIEVEPGSTSFVSEGGVLYTYGKSKILWISPKVVSLDIPAAVTSVATGYLSRPTLRSINVDAQNPVYKSVGGCLYDRAGTQLIAVPGGFASSLTIPEGVELILWEACAGSGIREVRFPSTLKYIEDDAFADCAQLQSVNMPDSVSAIGCSIFAGCSSLKSVKLSEGIAYLPMDTFGGCSALTDVTLPERLVYIEGGAFSGCRSLKRLEIPPAVCYIEESAFDGCDQLVRVDFMGDAPHTIVASNAEDWADNSEWAVPSRAFYVDASNATWTNLVQRGEFAGIKVIGTSSRRTLKPIQARIRVEDYAPYSTWWNESNGNASATGSASVNGISWRVYGEDAEFFRDLDVTTDISCWLAKPRAVMSVMEVPAYIYTKTEHSGDCVAALKSQAFEFAGELEKVTIPASMDEIGPWAFNGCTNLKEIVWNRDPKHMQCGSRSFSDVPCVDFGWAIQGSRLVGYWGVCPPNPQIPACVTGIGGNKYSNELAFECSQTLVSLTIPSSVTNIEEWAMTDCPNLRAVVFSGGLTHLPEGLFDQDMKLANVILPASITSVGKMSLSEIAGPVVFQGDKPSVSGSPFASSDSYKVYFLPGTKGWEDGGTWYGMRTYAISQEELAQIKRDRSADMRATLDGGRATEFTIQFNANGGTGTMRSVVVRYDNEGAMPKNAFSKNGAHFIGWSETPDGPAVYRDGASLKSLAIDADGVARLYAKWASNAYTISFDANGGEGEMQPVDCQLNQALSLPSNLFTNLGCTFVGWALSDDRQTVVYSNRQSVSNLIALSGLGETLYAVWQTNRYNVVFNANKGSGTMRDQDFAYGETKALSSNDFVRVGHDYLGWSLTPDGVVDYRDGEIVSNLTAVANQTVTLYAKWHSHTYRVVFDANGGTGTMPDTAFNCGTIYQLPKNTFTFGGLVFIGWAREPEGPVVYRNGSEVVDLAVDDDAEITLYAVWSDTYPWTAEADGPFDPLVANVYDGYLVDEAQAVVGTIQVKTARQAVKTVTDKVTKVKSVVTNVAVTATVTDPAAKK